MPGKKRVNTEKVLNGIIATYILFHSVNFLFGWSAFAVLLLF